MKKLLIGLLALSLLLNVGLAAGLLYVGLMGCAEISNGKVGVLSRDIEVGHFSGSGIIFTLPKGLVVRDASATGADWFEPNRFRLVITSEDANLVNYSADSVPESGHDDEFYSADIHRRKNKGATSGAIER